MWHRLKQKFSHAGHWQRIEDGINRGIPDVNYCIRGVEGWIELKEIANWPRRVNTPVVFRWEKEQRFWARRRGKAGGLVWLLLAVKESREWLLFWWEDVISNDFGRTLNTHEVRKLATGITTGSEKGNADLLEALSGGSIY